MRGKSLVAGLLLPLLLFFVLLFGVTPWVIGLNVHESTMQSLINLFPPETRPQLQAHEQAFERGWFQSETVWRLDYQPLGLEESIEIDLHFDILHGPLLPTPEGLRVGLAHARIVPIVDDETVARELNEIPFALPDLTMDLLVALNQSLTLDIDITPVNYSGDDGELIFEGLEARFVAHADQSADFDLRMGQFSAFSANGRLGFRIDGVEIQSHSDQINELLAPATARMAINSLSSSGGTPLSTGLITANSQLQPSSVGGSRIDYLQHLQVNEIDGQLPLSALDWTLEVNEVHTDLIYSYYELIAQVQRINTSGGPAASQLGVLGQQVGILLLRHSLVLDNRATATAWQGDHEFDLRVRWAGLPQLTDMTQFSINSALEATEITLSVALDLEAVMRSPYAEMVDPYVQQELIRVENGQIRLEASLRNTELIVNDQTIPLEPFL